MAGARLGGGQNQAVDLRGVLHGQGLGDHATERPAEHVDPAEAERGDEGAGLVGHAAGVSGEGRAEVLSTAEVGST